MSDGRDGPPFDGVSCPACPMEVRDLHATAHNYLNAYLSEDSPERVARKLGELEGSAARMSEIVAKHFANEAHALPSRQPSSHGERETDAGRIVADVEAELSFQSAKWGQQGYSLPVLVTVLSAELGELARAWLESDALPESAALARRLRSLGAVRTEAIQVAAVAVALVEALDRSVGADNIVPPA